MNKLNSKVTFFTKERNIYSCLTSKFISTICISKNISILLMCVSILYEYVFVTCAIYHVYCTKAFDSNNEMSIISFQWILRGLKYRVLISESISKMRYSTLVSGVITQAFTNGWAKWLSNYLRNTTGRLNL